MPKQSAGILLYRGINASLEVFLVHPGGPFYKKKDAGAWTIPKGEFTADEDPLAAAKREFLEETGQSISGEFIALTPIKQPGGKIVYAWAVAGDIDPEELRSNLFSLEWPPRSNKFQNFPEVDKGAWYSLDEARIKLLAAQLPLLDYLQEATIK